MRLLLSRRTPSSAFPRHTHRPRAHGPRLRSQPSAAYHPARRATAFFKDKLAPCLFKLRWLLLACRRRAACLSLEAPRGANHTSSSRPPASLPCAPLAAKLARRKAYKLVGSMQMLSSSESR